MKIQKISIKFINEKLTVKIDGGILNPREIETLAINDGFENSEEFFCFFNKDYQGEILHFTKLRY